MADPFPGFIRAPKAIWCPVCFCTIFTRKLLKPYDVCSDCGTRQYRSNLKP